MPDSLYYTYQYTMYNRCDKNSKHLSVVYKYKKFQFHLMQMQLQSK